MYDSEDSIEAPLLHRRMLEAMCFEDYADANDYGKRLYRSGVLGARAILDISKKLPSEYTTRDIGVVAESYVYDERFRIHEDADHFSDVDHLNGVLRGFDDRGLFIGTGWIRRHLEPTRQRMDRLGFQDELALLARYHGLCVMECLGVDGFTSRLKRRLLGYRLKKFEINADFVEPPEETSP